MAYVATLNSDSSADDDDNDDDDDGDDDRDMQPIGAKRQCVNIYHTSITLRKYLHVTYA